MRRNFIFILLLVLFVSLPSCKNTEDKKTNSSMSKTQSGGVENVDSDDDLLEDESSTETSQAGEAGGASSSSGVASKPGGTASVTASVKVSDKSEELYKDLKGTTVRVIAFAEPDTLTKMMVKEFQKKYECTVKMEIYSWADWQVKILEMVASKTPPDLAICFDQHFLKYATQNIIQPLDSFIDKDAPFWDQNILTNYKWNGKTYGVNTQALDGIVLHYNKNLLENAGLDGAADPYELYKKGEWTFDKFREYAKALKVSKDGKTSVWGYASWIHDAFILAAGGKGAQVKPNGTIAVTIDSNAEIEGIEMLRKMIHEDGSTSTEAMNNFNAYFNAQKAAFMAERPGYAVKDDSVKNSFEVGMVPMPKLNKSAKHYIPAITQSWAVPVGAKNPKGAMAYIYYSAIFSEANKDTSYALAQRRKVINDGHLKIYQDAVKNNSKNFSFLNSVGNWYDKQWPKLWNLVYVENKSAVAAAASAKSVIQYELEEMLKSAK